MKILLAVDGSACSDRAVKEITNRPWPEDSELRVLNVYELPLPATPEGWALPPNYFEEMDLVLRKQSETIVERALNTLRSKLTFNVTGLSAPGPAKATILDEAKNWGADLIVVGSHGYSRWERFLLGSVSQSVVSHAPCSVEVVRCPQSETVAKNEGARKEL